MAATMRDWDSLRLTLRTIAALVSTVSAVFWILFAIGQFFSFASETTFVAGAYLFGLNILAISVTTGLFGRGRLSSFLAQGVFLAMVAASLSLYPMPQVWKFPIRLTVHVIGLLAITLTIVSNSIPTSGRQRTARS